MNSAVEFIFNKNFVEKKRSVGPINSAWDLLEKHAACWNMLLKKKKQNKKKRRKTHTLGTEWQTHPSESFVDKEIWARDPL